MITPPHGKRAKFQGKSLASPNEGKPALNRQSMDHDHRPIWSQQYSRR